MEKEVVVAYVPMFSYRFATDSKHGKLAAVDFDDACRQLDEMVPESTIAGGAWGWVEDHDGCRYEVG